LRRVKRMSDYALILGGPIEGDLPSPLLFERIKAGAQYLREHPSARAVCSGGIKGETQRLSEAQIMKNALLKMGIEEERIILEDKAKTTLQNFQYTKLLLEEGARVVFITNKFHIWRCKKIMKKAGVSYTPLAAPNGKNSLGFRIREGFLRPLALVGIIW
jgi:uncharacterized SAM-binding protein YcdF (DUF218 family)